MEKIDDKVSIIMSIFKEKDNYIIDSIESIIKQSFENLEIIIVLDDPDNLKAIEIIKYYSNIDSRIINIINEKNIGLVKSLNKAFKLTTGNYIARMDADDISRNDRIEKQLEYMKNNNSDILGTRVNYINMNGEKLDIIDERPISYSDVKAELKYINSLVHPSWMIKREVFEKLEGYRDVDTAEDYDFLLRGMVAGFKIENMNDILLDYRFNENGISMKNGIKQFLIGNYLRKNRKKINNISEEDIKEFVFSMQSNIGFINYEKDKNKIHELKNHMYNPLAILKLLYIIINNCVLRELLVYKIKVKLFK